MPWLLYGFLSAVASALTAILAKLGVEGVPSTLATAIRTVVVLVVVWLATVWLGEPLSWHLGAGVFLMTMGALLTLS